MKKTASYLLSAALTVSMMAPATISVKAATGNEPIYSSPISVRLGYSAFQKDNYTFEVTGKYLLKQQNNIELTNGTYTIKKVSNNIQIVKNGTVVYTGNQVTIYPEVYDRNHTIKLGSYSFLGHMTFRINGNNVLPVNTLDQEDYLMGVVGYEMSDSWPVESLKAQAVTARSYSSGDIGKEIDNGENYQVYHGYNKSFSNVINAVESTRKQIMKYNGVSLGTNAFFSASNGGTTLTKVNSWGNATANVPYLVRKEDPYDARSAQVGNKNADWSFTIEKSQLSLSGLDLTHPGNWWATTQEKEIDKTNGIKNFIKRYNSNLNSYELKIVSVDSVQFTNHSGSVAAADTLTGTLNATYLAYNPTTNQFEKNADGTIKMNKFTKQVRTYDFYTYKAFGTKDNKSILLGPNVKSVSSTSTQFIVKGGGWGHGIGMSQYGAYQMAKEGKKYTDILSFYYPSTTITPVDSNGNITPPPTVIPTRYLAYPNEAINLRSSGSWSATPITVVPKNAEMNVLDMSTDWYKASYNGYVGYVHKDFVTLKDTNTQNPTPSQLELNLGKFTSTNDVFAGDYKLNQKANIAITLNGPNNIQKLTFVNTMDAGVHSFGGPISQLPAGDYKLTIRAEKDKNTAKETVVKFTKKGTVETQLSDVSVTSSTFSGQFTVSQDADVSLYLTGPNVQKYFYHQKVEKGTLPFGGPLNDFPDGNYVVRIVAQNENGTTETTKSFNLKRNNPTKLSLQSFTFKDGIFSGTYSIDQESLVSVQLNGPNGLQKLTFLQKLSPGTHPFGGNISTFAKGNYQIVITATNNSDVRSVTSTSFTFGNTATAKTYTVISGDTLFAISRKNNISVDTIMKLNNLTSTSIRVGQVLKIS